MRKKFFGKEFLGNVSVAFLAQGISLLVSLVMSIFAPKFLDENEFAYWQLFIFYITYVGLFHFGLSDGVYLRYGGCTKSGLDERLLGSQLRLMSLFHILVTGITACVLCRLPIDEGRVHVFLLTGVFLIVGNIFWYCGFVFQAINETKVYSMGIIITRGAFFLSAIAAFLIGYRKAFTYIVLYTISQGLGTAFVLIKGKWFVFSSFVGWTETIGECVKNIAAGISLTISNVAGNLILGIGRAIVDVGNGLVAFGLVSYAVAMTNFFLQFISQISMVMFPALRRLNKDQSNSVYVNLRLLTGFAFNWIYIVYIPASILLLHWLPAYADSFTYLTVLLPICVFDGKMQLLHGTMLKVYRKERTLLVINICVLGISTICSLICVFVLQSVFALSVSMVIMIALRCLLSSMLLSLKCGMQYDYEALWDVGGAVVFVGAKLAFTPLMTLAACCLFVFTYWIFERQRIYDAIRCLLSIRVDNEE